MHNEQYTETIAHQGSYLNWKSTTKQGNSTQIVRFRHFNTGRLLTVKEIKKEEGEKEGDEDVKYVLTLGDNIDVAEMNART